jgi:hypothetical protein
MTEALNKLGKEKLCGYRVSVNNPDEYLIFV